MTTSVKISQLPQLIEPQTGSLVVIVEHGVTHYIAASDLFNNNLSSSFASVTTNKITVSGSVNISGSTIQKGDNTLIGVTTLTGSTNILGDTKITGSVLISGSTTQIGNNTLSGNTILSGSLTISGSVTGALQVDGDINLASPHNFYRWGNRLFNYANYYNTGSIDLVSGSVTTLSYTSDVENGFTLVSGSQMKAAYTGYYNIQFSVQLQKSTSQPADVQIWYSKNGQTIPNTNSVFTLPFKSNLIAALNFFIPMNAGDYVELKATTSDSTVDAVTIPGNGTIPASPALVVTISQVS